MTSTITRSHAPGLAGFLRRQALGLVLLAALIAFPFIFGLLSGGGVQAGPTKFWMGQLIAFFIMAAYAMSYDLLMGYTGILSFGHAAFFGGGAYAMGLFLKHIGPTFVKNTSLIVAGVNLTEYVMVLLGFLLALGVSIVLGLVFSVTSARVKGVYFAMITLAMAEAINILTRATDFVKYTGADEGLHGIPLPAWLNPTQQRLQYYFICLVFVVVVYLFLRRVTESPAGSVFIALRENESRVRAIGYNPAVYRALSFTISAMVAGLAGAMFAIWNASATPTMTSALTTINALIMTILGGIGTLVGPILGAGIMQIFGQFFYEWFGPRWPLVFGLIFIALVLFLPYGIVGTWRMRKAERRAGWKRLRDLLR